MPLAIWNGPADALLPDGRLIRVGDEIEVTDGDLLSSYWLPVDELEPDPEPAHDAPAPDAAVPPSFQGPAETESDDD